MRFIFLVVLILLGMVALVQGQDLEVPYPETCISSDYGPRNKHNYPSVDYDFYMGIDYATAAGLIIIPGV